MPSYKRNGHSQRFWQEPSPVRRSDRTEIGRNKARIKHYLLLLYFQFENIGKVSFIPELGAKKAETQHMFHSRVYIASPNREGWKRFRLPATVNAASAHVRILLIT